MERICSFAVVERLNGTMLEEFFRWVMHAQSVEALQADLDASLRHYHRARPHLDYCN